MTFEERFKEEFGEFPTVSLQRDQYGIPDNHMDNGLKVLLNMSKEQMVTKFVALGKDEINLARVINNLKKSQLYMSHPAQFNDEFDTKVKLTENDKNRLCTEFCINVKKLEEYSNEINYIYRILSLSLLEPLNCYSSHMWGLYANSGNGVAIVYNLQEILNNVIIDESPNPQPPIVDNLYESSKKQLRFGCMLYDSNYNPLERFKEHIQIPLKEGKYTEFMMHKHLQWEYECEVRIIHKLDIEYFCWTMVDLKKYKEWKDIEFLKAARSFLPMPKPEAIYIGWKVTCEVIEKIRSIKELDGVKIYKLTGDLDYDNHRYEIEHIN